MEQKGITPDEMKAAMREAAEESLKEVPANGTDPVAKFERMMAEMTVRAHKHLKVAAEKNSKVDYAAALELTYMVEFGLALLNNSK